MPKRTVAFYLDPGCPWTWLTSRWLVDVTSRAGRFHGEFGRRFHDGEVPAEIDPVDAAARAASVDPEPAFFEVKRGRSTGPALGARR